MSRGKEWWRSLVYFFLLLAFALICLQIWSAFATRTVVQRAQFDAETFSGESGAVEREKARQELVGRIIENESKGVLQILLATGVGTLAAVLVTISGAILALSSYLDAREKERRDRLDAREKEREDRLATALSETLTRLVADESRQRVVGAAGLLPFFTEDHSDFHLQAFTALVAAARSDDELPQVRQGIRLAIEQALGVIGNDVLRQVSLQGVQLSGLNLTGRDLRGLDLRDAVLENAKLVDARLDDADLSATKLQGAQLQGASLIRSKLVYADLAGASLAQAKLGGANLDGVKVLNLDLDQADLRGIDASWHRVPWDATRNWRKAVFDDDVRAQLETIYGPEVPGTRVLMLMWELPPMIAGGTWTACYHLVRNLRRRGAQVTVVVPWSRKTLVDLPFGTEVPILALDIEPPEANELGSGASPAWSPYGGGSTAGYSGWSPYGGGGAPFWSTYAGRAGAASGYGGPYGNRSFGPYPPYGYGVPGSVYGSYGSGSSSGASSLSGSVLFRLIGEFQRRVEALVREQSIDLIHAHDWVTFDAARAAAKTSKVPWIAHFHSTEADRQPDQRDALTERIEQGAIDSATRIVTPSRATRQRLIENYAATENRIDVVPNMLSEGAPSSADMGRFESKRVVFLGRLSRQKGVDRFCAVADAVRQAGGNARFEVFGDGEDRRELSGHEVLWNGPLGWDERVRAFRGASAILVPSRSEPFGMVILEALQHRVPVLYPYDSGAAEVLESGVKIHADDIKEIAEQVTRLLGSLENWESCVRAEAKEIDAYPTRGYEDQLIGVWQQAVAQGMHPS